MPTPSPVPSSQAAPPVTQVATLPPSRSGFGEPATYVDAAVTATADGASAVLPSSATRSFSEEPSPLELSGLEAALEQQPWILVAVASVLVVVYFVAGELGHSRGP
ncbi:hypothetical protein CLOM_g15062 [Closterium sp. NIES-68]|nr:hypothetical protein CLOM_g22436 [Closterium sp. NIES-68]GJP56012.1 hypothetical protein CLOM_g15062 [Closterium sp. NIES-68]GJP70220.1 hypothetical protein CLOP_g1185 [Closterium sp. NIES-67]